MEKLLRRSEVERRYSLSRSTIYDMMSKGRFPRPIRLGNRSVRWRLSDLEAWLSSLPVRLSIALGNVPYNGDSNDASERFEGCSFGD